MVLCIFLDTIAYIGMHALKKSPIGIKNYTETIIHREGRGMNCDSKQMKI